MIAVLDFGSQYSQLIVRRVREARVYSQLFPHHTPAEIVTASVPVGYILSGGPASVYEDGAPQVPEYVLRSGKPILGICYGMQALTHALGGKVRPSVQREYGPAQVVCLQDNLLLSPGAQPVWMSHGDRIERMPSGFDAIARSENSPIAAMADGQRQWYGVQFHPEVRHTPGGSAILRAFVLDICRARPEWTPAAIVQESLARIRQQVGTGRAVAGISGGIDSAVASTLVHQALGDRMFGIFVDNGLLRQGEAAQVEADLGPLLGGQLRVVRAQLDFLDALRGVTDPEQKRSIIGRLFIRLFEREARNLGDVEYLVQGTIYPDVVESSGPDRRVAARIKTHHNVGGLPEDLGLKLVEPLRYLFKDEVRQVGRALGLPDWLVQRQPFPGPGLAVRCLGEVSPDRLRCLREADWILRTELDQAGLGEGELAQVFAVLLPVSSVGVMGDQRTYAETVVLRAVSTEDFMTADWVRLPYEVLARISNRIVNEVAGINRVVYDITSKPPATIEWE
ncbi:MAG: glutamine-hydrolyzing GMP synthase [Anaerolineales bacterium]|nr:glutamine-hydrolyzing GMP synthase [Anaerolineales bacterium]